MSSKKTYANGIYVPWYGYLMIFLLYATPFIVMTPAALMTGLFNMDDFDAIFRAPLINLFVAIVVIAGTIMTFVLRNTIKNAQLTPEGIKKFNKKLKLVDLLNILIPVGSMIWIGQAINLYIKTQGIKLSAFNGGTPGFFITMLLLGSLFDVSLLFYILHIRIIEPRIYNIPFTNKDIPLNIIQRNVLTLTFALLGCIFLIMITLTPANLGAGPQALYKRLMPILTYSVVYFAICTLLLVADIIKCLKQISAITAALSQKDYTVADGKPEHRSELGIIIQGMNAFKNQAGDILKEIEISTKKTSNQSDDLVHNMDLTKDNVANIVESISSIKQEIENQSAGVEESNSSIEQIMGNIRSLNNSIESQAAGVTQSSAAVEEMVANIASVTQILEKNNQVVNALTSAADKGQQQVKAAVKTADSVLQQSEGILQASSIIQNIASRTNLLAMNAAIESAHAGEAGKGFAVVASEVSKLAGQTVEAAQDTAELINASLRNVEQGINIANETAKKLDSMVGQVQGIADKVKIIAEASNSQAVSVKEMSANIGEISSVGQNNAATSEESLALSYEMNEHANSLKGLVEKFELKR
jgi:methyl-accepting chemotaxis protein